MREVENGARKCDGCDGVRMEGMRGRLRAQRSIRDGIRVNNAEMSGEGEDVECRGTECMKAWRKGSLRNDISVEQKKSSWL